MSYHKRCRRRRAISQSADLMMILAATLTAGGVVIGIITGLIPILGRSSTLTMVSKSLEVGTNGMSFAITLQNSGNVALTGAPTIIISGVTVPAGTYTFTSTGSVSWTVTTDAASGSAGTKYSATASSTTLSPGNQISLAFSINSTGGFTAGNTYQVLGNVGSQSFTLIVAATST